MRAKFFLAVTCSLVFIASFYFVTHTKATGHTTDWEMYRNSNYGFSLKYPPAWTVSEYPTNDGVDFWAPIDERGGFRIFISKIPKKQSLKKYLKELDKERAKPIIGYPSGFRVLKSKKRKIGKLSGIERKEDLGEGAGLTILSFYVQKGDSVYQFQIGPSADTGIYTKEDESMYRTILLTIQFEPVPTTKTISTNTQPSISKPTPALQSPQNISVSELEGVWQQEDRDPNSGMGGISYIAFHGNKACSGSLIVQDVDPCTWVEFSISGSSVTFQIPSELPFAPDPSQWTISKTSEGKLKAIHKDSFGRSSSGIYSRTSLQPNLYGY